MSKSTLTHYKITVTHTLLLFIALLKLPIYCPPKLNTSTNLLLFSKSCKITNRDDSKYFHISVETVHCIPLCMLNNWSIVLQVLVTSSTVLKILYWDLQPYKIHPHYFSQVRQHARASWSSWRIKLLTNLKLPAGWSRLRGKGCGIIPVPGAIWRLFNPV